jgi:hypothetical protein
VVFYCIFFQGKKELKCSGMFVTINKNKLISLHYHDRFYYPLTDRELVKWKAGKLIKVKPTSVSFKNGFYFLKGKEKLINLRLRKEKISLKKLERAKRAVSTLSMVPYIKFVGITGSLAMMNADVNSDIDLIIIVQKGSLWLTRFVSYLLLKISGYQIRKPNENKQKDKLCLNMWFDESDLLWPKQDRNYYTAHEFAQILPIMNRDKTYEKLLHLNKWILDYWPNSVKIIKPKTGISSGPLYDISYLEKVAYYFQYKHMENKITREIVTGTRAIFHPRGLPLDKKLKNF